jgi:8-oxo-dGTP diphosphatase
MKELPDDLVAFARRSIGEITAVTDWSWERENSAVWEVTGTGEPRWFIKRHSSPDFHEREVSAYQRWVPALGPARAPVLIAADARYLCIIVSGLPGQVVRGLAMTTEEEREIHYQAGTLLRAFHGAASPMDAMPVIHRAISQMETDLNCVMGLLTPPEITLVRKSVGDLTVLADLPAVAVHGDAQPRNWLWDHSAHRLAMIDFECAELSPAVRDLVRLEYGAWYKRPDLRQAFMIGYGRTLDPHEDEAFRCLLALDALNALQWGTTNHDQEIIGRARRTFDRLLVGHPQPMMGDQQEHLCPSDAMTGR